MRATVESGDTCVMKPLYDRLSMWPCFAEGRNHNIRQQTGLAMAMRSRNAQDRFDTLKARHWRRSRLACPRLSTAGLGTHSRQA